MAKLFTCFVPTYSETSFIIKLQIKWLEQSRRFRFSKPSFKLLNMDSNTHPKWEPGVENNFFHRKCFLIQEFGSKVHTKMRIGYS